VLLRLDALTVVLYPERARLLAGGFYDLTNPISHELRTLLMYIMAAVRFRDVLGARYLAHEIVPHIHNGLKEKLAELLRLVNRQRRRAVDT
jgi:signal transduction histidine kinase